MTHYETELVVRAQSAFREVLREIPDIGRRRALHRIALQGLLQAEVADIGETIHLAIRAMDRAALELEDLRAGERVKLLHLVEHRFPPSNGS